MIDQQTRISDPIAVSLRSYAHTLLLVVFGLLPLLFIPVPFAPFEYTKAFLVLGATIGALILYSLSILRSGTIAVGISYPLCALWFLAGVALVSSLLSGDLKDSLVGDFFSIHATAFVALLALVPTVWILLRPTKSAVMRLYIVLAGSTLFLLFFHIARLYFGAEFLSFNIFTNAVSSPVGTWNDLALFLGLTVILALVALEQLSLTKVGKLLFVAVTLLSLIMLGVINFFTVWIVLGLTSLVLVVYTLGKDRFATGQLSLMNDKNVRAKSLPVALVVFLVSTFFVIGGATFGGWIAKHTNISYVEVRPSLQATLDIARNVYGENAFFGIGANKFADAWRFYKDPSINTTVFWNTDFNAGNGYVTTSFVTMGVLGGIAWIVFLVSYFLVGARTLLYPVTQDRHWYFIGVSSFVSALYIWGMSVIYVPGIVILLLGALCTGVSLVAFQTLSGREQKTILVGTNRQTGFMLTLAVIVVIIVSVGTLYVAGRHYSSVYTFNESDYLTRQEGDINAREQEVLSAYALSTSDVFARRIAEYQFTRMNQLAATQNPSEEDQRLFQEVSANGINAALEAIKMDGNEPANWSVLGDIYGLLASVGVEGASEKAVEALGKSRELNPRNPLPLLALGIVEARAGRIPEARGYIEEAIRQKPNLTQAFQLLAQLEIATGNVEAAIESTRAIITLEPQNAARYYQLGVLESARNNIAGAIPAFEAAVELDQNYANARYLLALAYDQVDRSADAKAQFEKVLELNPGNAEVAALIDTINTEGSLERLRSGGLNQTVQESTPTTDENGTVRTEQETETPLVTPVNTPPATENESAEPIE